VQVWQQFHHQRIAYPKAVLEVSSAEKLWQEILG
jgi:hypothetical protein